MMTAADRRTVYTNQRCGFKLTPAQNRRLVKKVRRYDKRTLCPTCGVFGPLSCVTKTGNIAKASHAGRLAV